eukprot:Rmarinus@m.29004
MGLEEEATTKLIDGMRKRVSRKVFDRYSLGDTSVRETIMTAFRDVMKSMSPHEQSDLMLRVVDSGRVNPDKVIKLVEEMMPQLLAQDESAPETPEPASTDEVGSSKAPTKTPTSPPSSLPSAEDVHKAEEAKALGNTAYKQRKFKAALKHYDVAIGHDPTAMSLHTNKAAVFLEMAKYQECIDACDEALKVGTQCGTRTKPLTAKALSRRGMAKAALGHPDEATRDLKDSLSLVEDARVQQKIDQIRDKTQSDREVRRLRDDYQEYRRNADKFLQSSEPQKAIDAYSEALRLDSAIRNRGGRGVDDRYMMLLLRAISRSNVGDKARAIEDCDVALRECASPPAEVFNVKAQLLHDLGRRVEAVRTLVDGACGHTEDQGISDRLQPVLLELIADDNKNGRKWTPSSSDRARAEQMMSDPRSAALLQRLHTTPLHELIPSAGSNLRDLRDLGIMYLGGMLFGTDRAPAKPVMEQLLQPSGDEGENGVGTSGAEGADGADEKLEWWGKKESEAAEKKREALTKRFASEAHAGPKVTSQTSESPEEAWEREKRAMEESIRTGAAATAQLEESADFPVRREEDLVRKDCTAHKFKEDLKMKKTQALAGGEDYAKVEAKYSLAKADKENGGSTARYRWTQTVRDLQLVVPVPEATKSRNVEAQISATGLTLRVRSPKGQVVVMVTGEFHEAVREDGCFWTIEGKAIVITLEKQKQVYWEHVFEGDDPVDISDCQLTETNMDDLDDSMRENLVKSLGKLRATEKDSFHWKMKEARARAVQEGALPKGSAGA